MLRIVYKTLICQYEYNGKIDFFSGQVATFCGDREAKICDDISHPVGFFCYDYSNNGRVNSTRTAVAIGQSEFMILVRENPDHQDHKKCENTPSDSKVYYEPTEPIEVIVEESCDCDQRS